MTRATWLGVGLGAVLAAALLASRALLEAPIEVATAAPVLDPAPAPTAERPVAVRRVESPSGPAPVPAAPAPTGADRSATRPALIPPVEPDPPPVPDEDNPFLTEKSPELDYAFALVFGPHSNVDTARIAAEVFERCLKQAPQNHRCYRGLEAAQARQSPDWKPPPEGQKLKPDKPTPREEMRARLKPTGIAPVDGTPQAVEPP